MAKIDLTEEERDGIHKLRDYLDDLETGINQQGFSVGGRFYEQKRFLDGLIAKIDRAESGGRNG
jgi:hypothetical protein